MKNAKAVILIFLFLLAYTGTAQQYNFRNYSVSEGVAQSQVYSILQDSRAYIWMGTRGGGITSYDGLRFKTYTQKDGLSSNYIFSLKEDRSGKIWIGSNEGLSVFNGQNFINYPYQTKDSSSLWVLDFEFDRNGNIWIASNIGVIMFRDGQYQNISEKLWLKKVMINTLAIDSKDRIWYGNATSLACITQNGNSYDIRKYSKSDGYPGISINSLAFDKTGKLWMGSYGFGLFHFENDSIRPVSNDPFLRSQSIFDLNAEDEPYIYLATLNSGVIVYNKISGKYYVLSEKEGLSNNHVRSICRDRNGNFWFGTSGGGISSYFGNNFTVYDKTNVLSGNFIYSILRDSRNRLIVGNSDKGITILDNERISRFNASKGFKDLKVKAMIEDKHCRIFLGTEANGIYTMDDTIIQPIKELEKAYVRAFEMDENGDIIVATLGSGIIKIHTGDSGIEYLKLSDGLLSNRITCLYRDRRNRIWYGTENQGYSFISAFKPSGKVFNTVGNSAIRCFSESDDGRLRIGTAGKGIINMKMYDGSFSQELINNNSGLGSNNIYLLIEGIGNCIYSGTESGLDQIFFDTDSKVTQVKHHGKNEGFTGIEACQNSVWKDEDGTIWFGTINGLIRYNQTNGNRNKIEPATRISDVRLFYEPLASTEFKKYCSDWNVIKSFELPYNKNHLSFDFLGINLSNPDAVRYKWKLVGFDENWSPASSQSSVTYSNLPDGEYEFQVIACNEDGIWNKVPAKVHFTIKTPFWKNPFFILGALIIGALLIYLLFRFRIRQIRKKSAAEQEKLKIEKTLIELEQKSLRLQMNPHFIFNALNSIQSQIGTNNDQNARYYLAKFSHLMRQILDNSRQSAITLKDEIETLESYLLVERFSNGDHFDYSINIDPSIQTDFIEVPPMILQPFVENSIKHGLKHLKDKRGRIEISISESDNILICKVRDNGIGRKKSNEINNRSKETYHRSTALNVTEERLKFVNAELHFKSLEIHDLYEENENPKGTEVIIRIKIQ